MSFIQGIVHDLFMVSICGIDLPYFVFIYSVVILFPLQVWLCFKSTNKIITLLPTLFYVVVTIWYTALDLCGLHWDGVTYLVPAFLNAYLIIVCGLGFWFCKVIKDKGIHFTLIRIALILFASVFMMIAPEWLENHTPYEGAVGLVLVYYVSYPIFFGICGYLMGKNAKYVWPYPIIGTGLLFVGRAISLYQIIELLLIYWGIAVFTMVIGFLKKVIK